jgi:hypothetical protein
MDNFTTMLNIATVAGCSIYIFLTIKEKIELFNHKKDI